MSFQSMRKKLAMRRVFLGLAILSVIAALLGLYNRYCRVTIDREKCALIKEGMTKEEVIAIIGAPPGRYGGKSVGRSDRQPILDPGTEVWEDDKGAIIVDFGEDGRVEFKCYLAASGYRREEGSGISDWLDAAWRRLGRILD
jgi:hypothetical protein